MVSKNSPAIPRLDYAPPPGRRARWIRRIFLAALILSNLYFASDKWGGWVRLQSRMLVAQWRCMRYAEPSTRISFSSEPSDATALIGQGYRSSDSVAADGNPAPVFSPGSEAVYQNFESASALLGQTAATTAVGGAGAGGGLFANSSIPGFFGCAVFLHGRVSKAGHERLVVCETPISYGDMPPFSLYAKVIKPASLIGLRELEVSTSSDSAFSLLKQGDKRWIRLYAGQADPSDRARFTIHYATAAGEGTIEGTLTDADEVRFAIVDGPLVAHTGPPARSPTNEEEGNH